MGPGEAVPLSLGTLQGPEDKAENTQKAAKVTEQHDSCLLPWLRDRDGTLPASSRSPNPCCKMGPQCVLHTLQQRLCELYKAGEPLWEAQGGGCRKLPGLFNSGAQRSSEERPLMAGAGAGLQLGSVVLTEALADGSPL